MLHGSYSLMFIIAVLLSTRAFGRCWYFCSVEFHSSEKWFDRKNGCEVGIGRCAIVWTVTTTQLMCGVSSGRQVIWSEQLYSGARYLWVVILELGAMSPFWRLEFCVGVCVCIYAYVHHENMC